jgi:putative MFS transporter
VFAPDMVTLIVLRFIMGIGLGAELVIGYATLAEFVPPQQRGRLVATLSAIANSSVFVAALISLWVIPNFGWRAMFGLVGVLAIIVWVARKALPESPRWLESQGRLAEAETIVRAMEASAAQRGPLPPIPPPVSDRDPSRSFADLFGRHLREVVVGSTIMIVIGIVIYGFVAWLPTFFVKQGHSIVTSLTWSMIMSLGGPAGGLIGLALVDRLGRKPLLAGFAIAAAIIGLIYQSLTNDTALLVCGFLLISSIYTIIVVGQAIYLPEMFPTRIRMRGTGVCSTAGRLTSAGIQFLVVAIFNFGGLPGVLVFVICGLTVLALVILTLGKETTKLPLEAVQAVA